MNPSVSQKIMRLKKLSFKGLLVSKLLYSAIN